MNCNICDGNIYRQKYTCKKCKWKGEIENELDRKIQTKKNSGY